MSEHRLIYADELYDTLADKLTWLMRYGDDVYLEVGKDIREAINQQPTAYDIDDIVKQLEALKNFEARTGQNYCPDANEEECRYRYSDLGCSYCAFDKAIEIVKGGSNEMNRNITYCINNDCPFKDCERHMAQIPTKEGVYTLANFDGVCKRYIKFVASEVAK